MVDMVPGLGRGYPPQGDVGAQPSTTVPAARDAIPSGSTASDGGKTTRVSPVEQLLTSFELLPGQAERPRIGFVGPSFSQATPPPTSATDVDAALKSYQTAATRAAGLSLLSTLVSSLISGFRRISQGN